MPAVPAGSQAGLALGARVAEPEEQEAAPEDLAVLAGPVAVRAELGVPAEGSAAWGDRT